MLRERHDDGVVVQRQHKRLGDRRHALRQRAEVAAVHGHAGARRVGRRDPRRHDRRRDDQDVLLRLRSRVCNAGAPVVRRIAGHSLGALQQGRPWPDPRRRRHRHADPGLRPEPRDERDDEGQLRLHAQVRRGVAAHAAGVAAALRGPQRRRRPGRVVHPVGRLAHRRAVRRPRPGHRLGRGLHRRALRHRCPLAHQRHAVRV
mmetsp:Transcript_692/g.2419  ORF Transcript_692/g.2419 Transcript_692/m.2419 type:complete len:203 (+) Transcript_692:596-1204(+)